MTKLMNEVRPTFGATGFFIMRPNRGARLHNLTSDMPAGLGLLQAGRQCHDSHGEIKQPIGQFIAFHGNPHKSIQKEQENEKPTTDNGRPGNGILH